MLHCQHQHRHVRNSGSAHGMRARWRALANRLACRQATTFTEKAHMSSISKQPQRDINHKRLCSHTCASAMVCYLRLRNDQVVTLLSIRNRWTCTGNEGASTQCSARHCWGQAVLEWLQRLLLACQPCHLPVFPQQSCQCSEYILAMHAFARVERCSNQCYSSTTATTTLENLMQHCCALK